MLTFGIILLLWGIFAVSDSMFFTVVSVFLIAWLLIIGGIIEGVEAVHAFRNHERHAIWSVIDALLAVAAGVLLFRRPAAGVLLITLLLASYFVISGIFRIIAALALRLPNWGWTLFSGLISLALGIVIWGGWPSSAFWMLGLFVGISLIFMGWARIMLALALRGGGHHLGHPLPA